MLIEQIWTGNPFRNFNYLVACPESGEAMAIDPLDHEKCLGVARDKGWNITQVLNTHEHPDHIGGNVQVIEATGATLLAPANAGESIPNVDRGLKAGDVVEVGSSVAFETLDTPGHTMSHVCLLSRTELPVLFCGDTIFNAGVGNCHHGGHPVELYRTFVDQIAKLPDETLIYPGHDYIVGNLKFTLDREPDNEAAKDLLEKVASQDPDNALVSDLALERQVNVFMRLDSPSIAETLRSTFPDLPEELDSQTVFLKLRELRNSW
ncbi:MAG: hydroxyacylglutathione hydrolase [Pseudomonadota bacterium]